MKLIYEAKDFDSAYVVSNWPWGWTLKTEARFWIETTKAGDRFVQQTMNPKTGKWCKPKKGTYDAVLVLGVTGAGIVTRVGFAKGANDKTIAAMVDKLDWEKLNDMQKKQVCKWTAWNEVMSNVTFECKTYTPGDPAADEMQRKSDQTMAKVAALANQKTVQCLTKNGLI